MGMDKQITRRTAGATTMNCLIVAGCAALAVLVLGAVGEGGRRRAKEIVCQSNLRQWGGIFQGYVNQNGGRFFSGDPGTPGYWWPKYLPEEHRDWKRMRIWFCPQAEKPVIDGYGTASPTLNVFNAWGIFTQTGLGPHGISGSYGLNGYLLNVPSYTTFESGVRANDAWGNLADLPEAGSVPMFLDALRFDLWPLPTDRPAENEYAAWTGNMMARCCINRHNGAVNCLFVDGSVRKVGLKELWTLKWHRSFDTAGPWTKAGGVLPTDWLEWMRGFREY
jgi:prepilin-type processing-associated H-X9-DG protein